MFVKVTSGLLFAKLTSARLPLQPEVNFSIEVQKPPMKQEDLAREINLMGMEMTPLIISRIEKGQRHVCDAELVMLAKALGVTMDWLCEIE